MKKKRIITGITSFMVITAITLIIMVVMPMMLVFSLDITSEKPNSTVKNVYIKEDDNSSDNNAEIKILVELETEGETEFVTLSYDKNSMIVFGVYVMVLVAAVAVGVYTYMKCDERISAERLSADSDYDIARKNRFMSLKIP